LRFETKSRVRIEKSLLGVRTATALMSTKALESTNPSMANVPVSVLSFQVHPLGADFGGSRHRCGQGESRIVLVSRLFAPVRGISRLCALSKPSPRVDFVSRTSPLGDGHCQPAELGRAVKDGPKGPSAASRAAASLTARNSRATREIASSGCSGTEGDYGPPGRGPSRGRWGLPPGAASPGASPK